MPHTPGARAAPGLGVAVVLLAATLGWGGVAVALLVARAAVLLWCVASAAIGVIVLGAVLFRSRRTQLRAHARGHIMRSALTCALVAAALAAVVWALALAQLQTREVALQEHSSAEASATELALRLTEFPKAKNGASGPVRWVIAELPENGQRVRVWIADEPPAWAGPGSVAVVQGRLKSQAFRDPEAFVINAKQVRWIRGAGPVAHFSSVLAVHRHQLRALASHREATALLPGYAVGDTSLAAQNLMQAMQQSGLLHLTAVSGGNCALVIAGITWLVARLGAGRKVRLVSGGIGVLAFAAAVGPDPSLSRALIMCLVVLAGQFGSRKSSGLLALGLAAIVLLCLDPWHALRAGFALSISATAGIIAWGEQLTVRLRQLLPKLLADPLAITCAAQLGCAPFLLLLTPNLNLSSLVANLFAAPLAPAATGLGLGVFLTSWCAPVANLLLFGAILPCWLLQQLAVFGAQLTFLTLSWQSGLVGAVLAAGAMLSLQLLWFMSSAADQRSRWIRRVRTALLAVAAAVIVLQTSAIPVSAKLSTPRDWIAVFCDVGQGDALLIRDPQHAAAAVLIDTGEDQTKLTQCLDKFGVNQLALIVLTHDDKDHIGALSAVASKTKTALIAPHTTTQAREGRPLLRDLQEHEIAFAQGAAGSTVQLAANGSAKLCDALEKCDTARPIISLEILAPAPGQETAEKNDNSLIIRARVASHTFLLLADSGQEQQQQLIDAHDPQALRADVVKVAHHGSRDHEPKLAQLAHPNWALIGVGAGNSYGHPTQTAIDSFTASGARVLRTDQNGSIAILESGAAWVEKPG